MFVWFHSDIRVAPAVNGDTVAAGADAKEEIAPLCICVGSLIHFSYVTFRAGNQDNWYALYWRAPIGNRAQYTVNFCHPRSNEHFYGIINTSSVIRGC